MLSNEVDSLLQFFLLVALLLANFLSILIISFDATHKYIINVCTDGYGETWDVRCMLWLDLLLESVTILNKNLKYWIWCTFWFNAGSRIIENDLSFFYIYSLCGGALTLQDTIIIHFLTRRGKANLYLT